MSRQNSIDSLKLSLVPAVLASSCCLTVPALALLGISIGENYFYEHRWMLRLAAAVVLVGSLGFYLFNQGIKDKMSYSANKQTVLLISLQTILFAVVFYIIFLYVIVPLICALTSSGSCTI